jgi:CheY-like chemotaxis protein
MRQPRNSENPLAGVSILVVDDDELVRRAVARLLVTAGGYVRDAPDGDQAIAIATSERVDLLLTDMNMPGRDGAAVAHAIVALRPSVAVVFMSGRPQASHIERGRLTVADLFVDKPFVPSLLIETLARAFVATSRVDARDRGAAVR